MTDTQWWQKHDEEEFFVVNAHALTALEMAWLDDAGRRAIEQSAPHSAARMKATASWLCNRHAFRMIADCMVSMAERLLGDIPSDEYWKLWVICDSNEMDPLEFAEEGELAVKIDYNPASLLFASDLERKREIVSLLETAADVAQAQTGMNMDGLREACTEIRRRNYRNEWVWGEAVSADGKTAKVVVAHDTEHLKIYVLVYGRNGHLIERALVVDAPPYGSDVWHRHLGDIYWNAAGRVVFVDGEDEVII